MRIEVLTLTGNVLGREDRRDRVMLSVDANATLALLVEESGSSHPVREDDVHEVGGEG